MIEVNAVIEGRVWRFGDNIDTDVIVPGKYLVHDLPKIAQHVMEGIRPGFAQECGAGDIIVGGTNFGTGSSREMAPLGLQAAGISAIVARSFARIFFRNCINVGLAPVECEDADAKTCAGPYGDITAGAGDRHINSVSLIVGYAFSGANRNTR